jgi:hypothetical protein
MKIGKYIPLGNYNNIKIGYGTIDHKNLKSIYIKFNSWLQPNDLTEDYKSIVTKSSKRIRQLIYNLDDSRFKKECIVDLDIKTKGITLEKKSFMNLEITLYTNGFFDIKTNDVENSIKDLTLSVVNECLIEKSLYNFNLKKQ